MDTLSDDGGSCGPVLARNGAVVMEIRSTSDEVMVGVTLQIEAPMVALMEEGGVDEFAKHAHELLDEKLKPLYALDVMKKVTQSASQQKEKKAEQAPV
jgi:hypothetical protein